MFVNPPYLSVVILLQTTRILCLLQTTRILWFEGSGIMALMKSFLFRGAECEKGIMACLAGLGFRV